ncbi:hypothetical protein [Dietzia sp. B32]|uniref:hypothetical protein n=1 Tax=Dietzia sp. B32 TaxID=2915130 RepID=UPI0021ADA30F|nr:hypothetical protein [Dietzia sp. B32]UVE96765.1 hypothetical protein L8M95_08405 [Dietzia sp. B32]
MPTVTRDTEPRGPVRPERPDPAARVRRLVGSAWERSARSTDTAIDPDGCGPVEAALARFDAPVDIRIRGGLGSGRRTLAAALRARRGWRAQIDDLDVLAAPGAPAAAAPDVEILCLRTAPCRHEEAWTRRPRRHALLVVATGVGDGDGGDRGHDRDDDRDDDEAPPRWARGLPAVDAREPEHRSVDRVVSFVDRALETLATVRVARLEAELERLAVHDEVGDLAEAALCALTGPDPS